MKNGFTPSAEVVAFCYSFAAADGGGFTNDAIRTAAALESLKALKRIGSDLGAIRSLLFRQETNHLRALHKKKRDAAKRKKAREAKRAAKSVGDFVEQARRAAGGGK